MEIRILSSVFSYYITRASSNQSLRLIQVDINTTYRHQVKQHSPVYIVLVFYCSVNNFNSDVHKSVQHHTIQINQPTRCNSFTSLLLDVYVWLNIFRAPFRPSSGAYYCTRSLWFHRWRVAVGASLVVVCRPRPMKLQPPLSNGKTRGS
jgi:hypothetical protein